MSELDIDLKNYKLSHPFNALVDKLKPKHVWATSYGLPHGRTLEALLELAKRWPKTKFRYLFGYAHNEPAAVVRTYERLKMLQEPVNLAVTFRAKMHVKLWRLDQRYFVGSANLGPEGYHNIMVEVTEQKQQAVLREHVIKLFDGRVARIHLNLLHS